VTEPVKPPAVLVTLDELPLVSAPTVPEQFVSHVTVCDEQLVFCQSAKGITCANADPAPVTSVRIMSDRNHLRISTPESR
jgi:hypothetical protein